MGMDLSGAAGGYFRFNNRGWADVLDLAELYGWEPVGTASPRNFETGEPQYADWDGGYGSNDYQIVTAPDAAAIATALEAALDDIPDVVPVHKLKAVQLGP